MVRGLSASSLLGNARTIYSEFMAYEIVAHDRSIEDVVRLGILETDSPPPNDEECRSILEEDLIKKHLKFWR